MRNFLNKRNIFILIIFLITILSSSNLSAITYRDSYMIQIAFQHGFQYAMKLDERNYQKLKNNILLQQEKANELSQRYLKIVQGMNY